MSKLKIILSIFLLSLLLVSCGKKQEEVKKNSENKVKRENVVKKEEKKDFKLEKFNKDITKISFLELNNSLYSNWWWENLKEKIRILSSTGQTIENKQKATFLESFLWDYKNALKNREKLCRENNKSNFCKKIDLKLISYRPIDYKWNIIDNVKISIDWREKWKLKWKNSFNIENKFIHRIKISKEWYLDFYKKIFIDDNSFRKESINPKLRKADLVKIINSDKKENIKTNNFEYSISENSFSTKKWKKYSWKVKLYVFDIWENDWDLNVLNLDTFDKDWNYVWNSMVTFGMPLIKAYDLKWNELKISKAIVWKWKIQNKEKAPNIDLIWVSKNKWLDRNDLEKYNIPPFWYLDQDNWVWRESQIKILNSKWYYEFKLY